MSNHASLQMDWGLVQKTCGLKKFLAEVGQEDKNQLVVRHPNVVNIVEGANTNASSPVLKLSINIVILAKTYGKGNHYFCKEANFPMLTPVTIIETKNVSDTSEAWTTT